MTRGPDTVGEIMTRTVVAVSPNDTVEHAVRAMVEHDIGSVMVVDADKPVGVFTERDLTRRVADDPGLLGRPVGDVMSSPVVAAHPDAQIQEAIDTMNVSRVRRLAVMDGDRLVGIVTERDLLHWVGAVAAE